MSLDEMLEIDPNVNIIVAGDLNDFSILFLHEQFDLIDKVNTPTRINSILDRILVDEELSVLYEDSAIIGPPIKNSDHSSVLLSPICKVKHSINRRRILVWDFCESLLLEFLNFF